jgi:hypothetical protein
VAPTALSFEMSLFIRRKVCEIVTTIVKSVTEKQLVIFGTGTQSKMIENELGIQVDLSWFSIISSIISIIGMLNGALWITEPIQKVTNGPTGKLTFFPLFFYRLLAWLMIITFLHSFSFIVLAGQALLNAVVLLLFQDHKLTVEPIVQSILSLAFPVTR